jgi:hypothetical protein
MRSIIQFIATNKFLHMFLGIVVAGSGLLEVGETILEDITSGNLHGGHGVVVIGILQVCKSLGDIIEGSDYLKEAMD